MIIINWLVIIVGIVELLINNGYGMVREIKMIPVRYIEDGHIERWGCKKTAYTN